MNKLSFLIAQSLLTAVLLVCSVYGIKFDCNFGWHTPWSWVPIGTRYTCVATLTNVDSTTLESVTGVHESGRYNDDVEYLIIENQQLTSVPEGIADFFKNLNMLLIDNSSLMSISVNDLRQFPRLLLLDLYCNELTSIDSDLFRFTPHMQYVTFANNRIQHIGHELVNNLKNLTYLYFNDNVCIDRAARTRAEVLSLAPQLSVFCPSLDVATTTKAATTTEINFEQCI